MVHYDLPTPIRAVMDSAVLYDMETRHREPVEVELISISSYKGSVPTFNVLVENRSIFSYVPPHLLYPKNVRLEDKLIEKELVPWTLDDLCYTNCPDNDCKISIWNNLPHHLNCYFPTRKTWYSAVYQFTMDWPDQNELMHCVVVEPSGRIAFVPNHKIQVADGNQYHILPSFRKLHEIWTLDRKK